MMRRDDVNVLLIWIGIILFLAVMWLICMGSGLIVFG